VAEVIRVRSIAVKKSNIQQLAINLFLVGFLVLFLELSCIRWFASYVIFLQFFINVALIASFLGMTCGCLAASRRRNWLEYFPLIALGAVVAALTAAAGLHLWSGVWSPQEAFFATEYRDPDLAKFVVPIEAIAAFFFVLIALIFVGLGQVLGRAFDAYPNRILGYTLNIGGSLTGIAGFSALSFLQAPPAVWFLVTCVGVAYLLRQTGSLTLPQILALVALVLALSAPNWLGGGKHETRWSPYYIVDHDIDAHSISVNAIAHQSMVPFSSAGALYSLIHLLQQHSGGGAFRDVLIIGAGSGNDAAHALKFGAQRIDAVEIDPVILEIGRRYHPDKPYQDPRVTTSLDDGRHILRTTEQKYDLVVYSLVDSLLLHSSYANIRLESYLFTRQAFADVRRVLKRDGVFVMYNVFRQRWIIERIAAMIETAFGCRPTVLSLPSYLNSLTMTIAGCNSGIADAFVRHKEFWLNPVPPRNLNIDGFTLKPEALPAGEAGNFQRILPALLAYDGKNLSTSDDWPFLYLSGRLIPDFTIRSMVLLGVLGLGMVYLFLPKGQPTGAIALDSRMFFLGAAFLLLETRAVTQTALLFGSTWIVNSSVFFVILILILLSNIYVLKVQSINLIWHYLGLAVFLMLGVLVPLDIFLAGGTLWRYIAPCVLALSPVFFAGVIFAVSFRNAPHPDLALGSNIAGSVVGGLAESLSMLLGFQYLLLVALGFYLLSTWSPRVPIAATRY
jgi:SAM-dependent methyltransferase